MFHVKQDLPLPELIQFLKSQNILLNSYQINQLEDYYAELIVWSTKMNLISCGDKKYIIERHILPSFYYLNYLSKESGELNNQILDFGAGAGLPGIILAIALPDKEITLLDSSRKKTLFLKNLAGKLKLKVNIVCERIENINNTHFTKFDIIVARAVASIPVLVDWCLPLLRDDGQLLTVKGDNYQNELSEDMNINLTELLPNPAWIHFSDYLMNKRMIKISRQ